MAWTVMYDVMQWMDANGDPASGYVLKAYLPGTTTATNIAIDKNGGSPQATITLNAEGKPEVSGNEIVPFIDREYKWAIFANATDAAANSNPYAGFYDNIPQVSSAETETVRYFDTVANMQAADDLSVGEALRIGERDSQLFNVIASTTNNGYDVIDGTGSSVSVRLDVLSIMPLRAFGTAGDNSTDDNGAIQAAFDSKARILLGHPDDIYLSNSQLDMGTGQTLDLCGSELRFDESGLVRYLVTNDDCTVKNGTVRSVTADVTVRGAEYQQPIVIGYSNSLTDFVKNVLVENVTLSSTSPEGNALFVFGACDNILCQNITIEAGSNLGEPIGGHWSVEPGGDETQGTGHPNNVTFRNVTIGAQTYGGAGAIFCSAVRGFVFENITVESYTGDAVMQVFAGDHGFTYANDNFGEDIGSVITVNNLQGIGTKGVIVEMQDTLEAQVTWPSNITISNSGVQSSSTTTTSSRGLEIGSVDNLRVENCSFDLFYNGIFLNSEVNDMVIEGSRFTNCYKSGVDADNSANCSNLTFKKVRFDSSNTAGGTGYDMIFGSYIDGINIEECIFNSANTTFSVNASSSEPPRNMRVINNHVENAGGTPFVFGSSSSFGICELFTGNTLSESLDLNIRGGQNLVAYSNTGIQNTKTPMREFNGPNSNPAYGTYHPGDRFYIETPTSASKIGRVCTAGGSEGTYSEGVTATTNGTTTVTLSAESNVLRKNDYVTINSTNVRIVSLSGTTLEASSTIAAGSGLAITYTGGTYVTWGATD